MLTSAHFFKVAFHVEAEFFSSATFFSVWPVTPVLSVLYSNWETYTHQSKHGVYAWAGEGSVCSVCVCMCAPYPPPPNVNSACEVDTVKITLKGNGPSCVNLSQ